MTPKKAMSCVALTIFLSFVASFLGLQFKQQVATTVFLGIICSTLFFWEMRLSFGFIGLTTLLLLGLLDVPHLVEFASLDLILFLIGMMLVIGFLEEKRFFEHVIEALINRVGVNAYRVVAVLMLASFISAALVDEVTSVLFMLTALLHLTTRHKVNPVPFILMVVFATNIGSSATVVGNPIGVMIALRAGLTF